MVEFNVNICILFTLIKLGCGNHRSLTNLCIFYPKFLDKLSCIIDLIDGITLLLDLKSMK